MVHDDVGWHLTEAGSFDRAAVPLGMYVAWLANHQLLDPALCERAGALVMRVRYREIAGSELALSGCGGVLESGQLSAQGEAFTRHYYPGYLDEFRVVFGGDPYAVPDDWEHYDRIAPRLTAALMQFRGAGREVERARGGRPWWRFWR